MSSGRTFLNTPRGALPTGVRVAATMYASCTCLPIFQSPVSILNHGGHGEHGGNSKKRKNMCDLRSGPGADMTIVCRFQLPNLSLLLPFLCVLRVLRGSDSVS